MKNAKTFHCPDCGGDCQTLIEAMRAALQKAREQANPVKLIDEVTMNGYCHDCAQGLIGKPIDGFGLFVLDGRPSHWFCRYCGSNHVTIRDEAGTTLFEEGDLYVA